MVFTFDVATDSSDLYRVVLSSGEDAFFANKDINKLLNDEVEIVEIDLERISGNNPTSLKTLMRISEGIGNYFAQNTKAVLYYYCDDLNEIPGRKNRNMWPQEYRSKLFGRMFQRHSREIEDVNDVVIILQEEERPIFMHLIARSEHKKYVDIIKDYVVTTYGK